MNTVTLLAFAAVVIYGVSAITCPRCTNENDWTSCTETHTCNNDQDDTCQFEVQNEGNRHRVVYHCAQIQNCQQHEVQNCNLAVHGHCIFCCDTIHACRIQREGVFDNLM